MTAIAASRQPVFRTPLEEGRGWARSWLKSHARCHRPILQLRIGSANFDGESCLILRSEMMADPFRQCSNAMLAKVVIEVSEDRHE